MWASCPPPRDPMHEGSSCDVDLGAPVARRERLIDTQHGLGARAELSRLDVGRLNTGRGVKRIPSIGCPGGSDFLRPLDIRAVLARDAIHDLQSHSDFSIDASRTSTAHRPSSPGLDGRLQGGRYLVAVRPTSDPAATISPTATAWTARSMAV